MALPPAALDPVKPQILHPRIAELWFVRFQTSLSSLIYGVNFRNDVRVTYSEPIYGVNFRNDVRVTYSEPGSKNELLSFPLYSPQFTILLVPVLFCP